MIHTIYLPYDIQDIEVEMYNEIIHEIPFISYFHWATVHENTKRKSSFIPFCLAQCAYPFVSLHVVALPSPKTLPKTEKETK